MKAICVHSHKAASSAVYTQVAKNKWARLHDPVAWPQVVTSAFLARYQKAGLAFDVTPKKP